MAIVAYLPTYTPPVDTMLVITCSFEVQATVIGSHPDFGGSIGYWLSWTQNGTTTTNALNGVSNARQRYTTSWTANVAGGSGVDVALRAVSAIGTTLAFYNVELRGESIKR